jgi:hypothetical protein
MRVIAGGLLAERFCAAPGGGVRVGLGGKVDDDLPQPLRGDRNEALAVGQNRDSTAKSCSSTQLIRSINPAVRPPQGRTRTSQAAPPTASPKRAAEDAWTG